MISCQNIIFNQKISNERISKFSCILGQKIVVRIIAFALFLLGVNKKIISELCNIPFFTLKSFFRSISTQGINAFKDGRKNERKEISKIISNQSIVYEIISGNKKLKIFNDKGIKINISDTNNYQLKLFIITLYQNKIIALQEAAKFLSISKSYVIKLSNKIRTNDATVLLDQRKGQKEDYIITREKKAEIIQQFAVNIAAGNKTSGNQLAKDLKERCSISLSDRTIRYHISKLGLSMIRKSFPKLIQNIKKNSKQ
jgi:hypothetical protein